MIELAFTSRERSRYHKHTGKIALDYEMFCDNLLCDEFDTLADVDIIRFDVSLELLECKKANYPLYLIVHNIEDKEKPYGILKMMLNMPQCKCGCEEGCNSGYEPFHPACRGGEKKCGVCGDCPDGTFGEFCQCNADGSKQLDNDLKPLPTVTKGQTDDLTGKAQAKDEDKFGFSHAIVDKDAAAYQIQCNGSLCKSYLHCGDAEEFALYGDHRLLPGAEITMKFSPCPNMISFIFGFGIPPTNTSLLAKITRIEKRAYMTEELHFWETSQYPIDGFDTRVATYKSLKWRYDRPLYNFVIEDKKGPALMNTTTIVKMKVTDSAVIWSWDGLTVGDVNYVKYAFFEFNPTSDDTQVSHEIDIRAKNYYPIVIYRNCQKLGDFATVEIIDSKVGEE